LNRLHDKYSSATTGMFGSQRQASLGFVDPLRRPEFPTGGPGPRAIEDEVFPFEELSDVAEVESWRKEINRPIYHLHKWWAQRLGSVFRAIVIGSLAPAGSNLLDLLYRPVRFPDAVVFDPFMGSGTTLGEALKLGARAVGRDINPVAHFLVRNALARHDEEAVLRMFRAIERDVSNTLRHYYKTMLPDGRKAEVLYFFWVKTAACPACGTSVDLFDSYVFAQHAYRRENPEAQALCPDCGAINEVRFDAHAVSCNICRRQFDPRLGPAKGQKARCSSCQQTFVIAQRIRESGRPPNHRLYAKLVLLDNGTKIYMPTSDFDQALYEEAAQALGKRPNPFPIVPIAAGYNTNQAIGYNYRHWHEMFNARQLLCLSVLADRIRMIKERELRELFTCLFSGTLEFNNMFTSYKGEGTGAVRHMFAHHILKPERTPLEANVWGTMKSSGAFSTLFRSRIQPALAYAQAPFEIRVVERDGRKSSEKVCGLSETVGFDIADSFAEFTSGKRVYLSCGDSAATDLPPESVDVVISDPPFFDNVHYSQLADFFHVWQRHILGSTGNRAANTTRSHREVQNSEAEIFTERLASVFREAHRVLKKHGLMVFTYHHSRREGWRSVLGALVLADFAVTTVQPIKAEMSVAMPKRQAKEPIDLDIIMVCRKRSRLRHHHYNGDFWGTIMAAVERQVKRLTASGRLLSRNDVRVILMAHLVRLLSVRQGVDSSRLDADNDEEIERRIEKIYAR
jgi:putative DNA methylase